MTVSMCAPVKKGSYGAVKSGLIRAEIADGDISANPMGDNLGLLFRKNAGSKIYLRR